LTFLSSSVKPQPVENDATTWYNTTTMRYLTYLGHDAPTNIATDAWLLNQLRPDEPVFALWQNAKAVIVGRNQNTFSEVNQAFVDAHQIQVVRRVSGGGAVYQDLGNLCFTFLIPVKSAAGVNFRQFVGPMHEALHSVGINADITGRNDLEINGKKISGNAQRYANGYLLHHGTLLWDVDVDMMVRALSVSAEKFIGKAAQSMRARVGNIKDSAPASLNLAKFWEALAFFLTNYGKDDEIKLTAAQMSEIRQLRDRQFATWEWNYGASPQFTFSNHAKFVGGSIEVQANVENGLVTAVNFVGDFLGVRDWREIREEFIGAPFDPLAIQKILDQNQGDQYFGSISASELAGLFANPAKVG